MSVINRLEISNCINLDNFLPSHPKWAPDYPYLEINFRGLSSAIKATNGKGKTTINNAFYALTTRDRLMISKFKSRMAAKRKGVWSHFRLEMLYKTPQDTLDPGLFGNDVAGEAWVFGMYGYSDGDVLFYCYRGHFEDCPLAIKDGHQHEMVQNESFTETFKLLPDAVIPNTVSDWKKRIGRHLDESLTHKMLTYHKAGGGDGTDNFFKVDRRPGEPYDTAFFYTHIAPETLVDCMGNYGDEDEYGFEDTLLKSATAILEAQHSVKQAEKEIEQLSQTHALLSSAKDHADRHHAAQESLANEARATLAEYHFLRNCTQGDPLPLLPKVMRHNSSQTQFIANTMVLQGGEWLLPDYVLSEITDTEPRVINQSADRKTLSWISLKRSQVIEIPCDLIIHGIGKRGQAGRAYHRDEALAICQVHGRFAEGWSRDAALRALNYAWDWRAGEGEHNVFRGLRRNSEAEIERLAKQIQTDEGDLHTKTGLLQRLNSEIQEMKVAVAALSEMRQSDLFTEEELSHPSVTGESVQQLLHDTGEALKLLQERNIAFEDGRKAYSRVIMEFDPQTPKESRDTLNAELENANEQSSQAKQKFSEAKDKERQARAEQAQARDALERINAQKGDIDHLAPHMKQFESLFPDENPTVLVKSVTQVLETAKSRQTELTLLIKHTTDIATQFADLAPGVSEYREVFADESPQGLTEKVTRALSDAEHEMQSSNNQQKIENEALQKLRKGQHHLAQVIDRFGEDVNVTKLESVLETRERETTESLIQLGEDIKHLAPLVSALNVFNESHPDTSPTALEQQRGIRRAAVAVTVNDLESDLERTNKQRTDLESFGAAAGRIANEVLDCVGGDPLRVHQAIEELNLPPERKQRITTHFSQVLHCPVYEDPNEAKAALDRLNDAGIEAPVFDLTGLESYCSNGELTSTDSHTHGLLAGEKTLQVRALLDPSYIPELIKQLEERIERIEETLFTLYDEQEDLSPESEHSQMIAKARIAVEEDAESAYKEAQSQQNLARDCLRKIQEQRSEDAIASIRVAAGYIEAGGEQTLNDQHARIKALSDRADELTNAMPALKVRASRRALTAISKMLEFVKLGGADTQKRNGDALVSYKSELSQIESHLSKLQWRFEHFSTISKANEFVELGGWEKANALIVEIDQTIARLDKAELAVSSATEASESAGNWVETTNDILIEATNRSSTWKMDIERAIGFEDDGGLSFDAKYVEKRERLMSTLERLDKRSRFQFAQAQQAVEAEKDPAYQEDKVKLRDAVSGEIHDLTIQIADCRNDQEHARQDVEKFRIAADKADTATKTVLDQWKEVRAIMDDLPSDQKEMVGGAENIFVQDSRRAASDMRDAYQTQRWNDALEELEGLAENILEFPLNQRRSAIKELTKECTQASKKLKNEITTVLDKPDNRLSEGEIEALGNPKSEADLAQSVLDLHRIIEDHLLSAERKQELNQQDVNSNKERMLASMAGFTDNVQDNFTLLKKTMSTSGGGASIKIKGDVIDTNHIKEKLDSLVEDIDTELKRRKKDQQKDQEKGRVSKESDQAFNDRLKHMIRSEFYRAAFRAKENSNDVGPRIFFNHPQIGGGRDLPLSKDVSTGQFNALTLLILVKLADFSMRRDARNEYEGIAISRVKRMAAARTVMIDGMFSNLSDRKMIRDSLNVLRSLKGNFQLIGWIHNQQYENDSTLFPTCVTIRRTGSDYGYVLAEDENAPPLPDTGQVAAMETHILPIEEEAQNAQ